MVEFGLVTRDGANIKITDRGSTSRRETRLALLRRPLVESRSITRRLSGSIMGVGAR